LKTLQVVGEKKSIYLANSHFDSITRCEGLLLLCFPSYLGLSVRLPHVPCWHCPNVP